MNSPTSAQAMEAILNGPAGTPPAGQKHNLVDPPRVGDAGAICLGLCAVLPVIFLGIRLYTRIFVIRKVMLSDYLMTLAWAISITFTSISWKLHSGAPGVDQWNLRVTDFMDMLYWFFILSLLYGIVMCALKIAILVQLLEMFGHRRDSFYYTCHGLIWLNALFFFILTFIQAFCCKPVHSFWNILDPERKCLDTAALNVSASSVNALSDIVILILPQFRIWKLQMSLIRRLIVGGVFLMGLLACVCSIVRLFYAVKYFQTPNNVSYVLYLAGLWCMPEQAAGIICGCLPTIPKFIKHLRQNWQGLTSNDTAQHKLNSSGQSSTYYSKYGKKLGSANPDLYPLTTYNSHSETAP